MNLSNEMKFAVLTAVASVVAFAVFDSLTAALAVGILIVLEVSLSFDNAVLNAKVLKGMSAEWQQRFLTWGMLIAVFGMRVVFPIAIVSIASGLSLMDVSTMTLNNPEKYAKMLEETHYMLSAFGGTFLFIVFLEFLYDSEREEKWFKPVENFFAKVGHLEGISILTVLSVILTVSSLVPTEHQLEVLFSSLIAVVISLALSISTEYLEKFQEGLKNYSTKSVVSAGLISFIYLEVLDASFSLDGVLGAFAISKFIIVIAVGLGIGALFVRAITLQLVRSGTLDNYIYLEHGAHYAIGALAFIMALSMFMHVNEVIAGTIGALFIGLGYWSSLKHKKNHPEMYQ